MARIEPVFSYEHLRHVPDDGNRYEILKGELVVTPAPSPRHQQIVVALSAFLHRAQRTGHGKVYVAPTDVVLHPTEAAVQLDLVFIVTDRLHIVTDARITGAPDLIVEVLSDSTRHRDLGVKLRQYARHEARWYWVVDPAGETVHVFALREGAYVQDAVLGRGGLITRPLFLDLRVDAAEVFE